MKLYRVHPTWVEFELTTLVMIGTDCIGICKSNYHTITTMTVNEKLQKNQYTTVEINISLIHMYMYLKDITKVKIVYKRSQWTNRQQSTITNLIIQRKTDRIKIECVYCQYAFPNNKWATTTASTSMTHRTSMFPNKILFRFTS
jgi:hypothetical protein